MTNIIIHHRSVHHARNSGYGQLADHVEGDVLPYLTSKFPYRIAKWLSKFPSKEYGSYDTISVIKDYELSKKLLIDKTKGIVHYLNGERDIRFGIQLNAIKKNYNFIASFHKPPEVLSSTFKNKYFKKLDGAIAVGENQLEFLKNWLNIENVTYIPHGIDADFFTPDVSKKEANTILFVGQHLRDFDAFNYSVPRLKESIPNLKVNVVLRKDFAKYIKPNSCITIYSGINDLELMSLYQRASLLFLPLLNSTACNSILEGMACGLPVISTDVGGNNGYVKNGSGVLVPLHDYDYLVEKTISIIKDENQLEIMSNSARTNSLNYRWEEISKKVNSYYNLLP
jgi:glycosyltransferase involved in cell wall biosynthesis